MILDEYDKAHLLQAFSRLRDFPVWKILRNISRDVVQTAFKLTPQGVTGRSEYARKTLKDKETCFYFRWDNLPKKTRERYIRYQKGHRAILRERKRPTPVSGAPRARRKARPYLKSFEAIYRLPLRPKRFWSLATWRGIAEDLGMNPRKIRPQNDPKAQYKALKYGSLTSRSGSYYAEFTIENAFRIGKHYGGVKKRICTEGLALGTERLRKAFWKLLVDIKKGKVRNDHGE